MKLANDLPDLTVAEVERLWMPPLDICNLAGISDARFVNNVSDRGHIPFAKSGARTRPRLYSMMSAIMLRSMREVVDAGRSYEFAAPLAKRVADLAKSIIERCRDVDDSATAEPDWLVVYEYHHGYPYIWDTVRAGDFNAEIFESGPTDFGVLRAGKIIWDVLERYPNYWMDDLDSRGLYIRPDTRISA